MTKPGYRSRTVSDRKYNNISFQRKKTGSWSRTNKNSSQTKNRPPEPNGPGPYTLILGFKQNLGSQRRAVPDRRHKQKYFVPNKIGSRSRTVSDRKHNNISFQRKKTGSWRRTNKNSSQTKNRPPEPNGPGRIH